MIATWPRREKRGLKRRYAVQTFLVCLLPAIQLITSIPFFIVWFAISLLSLSLRQASRNVTKIPFIPYCLFVWGLQLLAFCALSDLAHIHTRSVAAVPPRHADQLLDSLTKVLGRDRVNRISHYFDRNQPSPSQSLTLLNPLINHCTPLTLIASQITPTVHVQQSINPYIHIHTHTQYIHNTNIHIDDSTRRNAHWECQSMTGLVGWMNEGVQVGRLRL